jgi:hypothetical protein
MASLGGGRVLSAGHGVTGLTLFGGGSIMAMLAGAVVSLLVLRLAGRLKRRLGLLVVSMSAAASSAALLLLYLGAAGVIGGAPGALGQRLPAPAQFRLSGAYAWAFFAVLVMRCALWFAARSLRTGHLAGAAGEWLGASEAAYYGGLVVGLVVGSPRWLSGNVLVSTLVMDIALAVSASLLDVVALARLASYSKTSKTRAASAVALSPRAVAGIVVAYGAGVIACQITLFQAADWLARSHLPGARRTADLALAAFYLGLAAVASLNHQLRPRYLRAAGRRGSLLAAWHVPALLARRGGARTCGDGAELRVSLAAMCLVSGAPILAGALGLVYLAQAAAATGLGAGAGSIAAAPTVAVIVCLAAIVAGTAAFALLVMALIGWLATNGSGTVAAGIAAAGSMSTVAMFLMLALRAGPATWLAVCLCGLWALHRLVGDALRETAGSAG